MCVLCRDTFSRSDILKRHFQKCSIRRGNPTGASHLSHAQAHLKKSHPGPHKVHPPAEENLMNNMNGMNGIPADGNMHPFGISPDGRIPDAGSNLTDEQAAQEHLSRSNSLKRLSSGGGRDRRSMTGPGPNGSGRASFDQNYSGEIPSTMSSGMNPQLAAYSMPNGHNGAPFNPNFDFANQNHGLQPQQSGDIATMANGRGTMPMFGGSNGTQQHSNLDWSQMFQPGAQDGIMSPFNPNVGQSQIPIKTETLMANTNEALFNGIYLSAPIVSAKIGLLGLALVGECIDGVGWVLVVANVRRLAAVVCGLGMCRLPLIEKNRKNHGVGGRSGGPGSIGIEQIDFFHGIETALIYEYCGK